MTRLYFKGDVEIFEKGSEKIKYFTRLKIKACDEFLGEYSDVDCILEISQRRYKELQNKIFEMDKLRERLEIGTFLEVFVARTGD